MAFSSINCLAFSMCSAASAPSPQGTKDRFHILGHFCRECYALFRARMRERKLAGMKRLPLDRKRMFLLQQETYKFTFPIKYSSSIISPTTAIFTLSNLFNISSSLSAEIINYPFFKYYI